MEKGYVGSFRNFLWGRSMNTAEAIVGLVRIWFMVGALVAAVFLIIGIDRIDEDARGAYVFRPLLVPGILLIWPLVLWRWWVLETGRSSRAEGARLRCVRTGLGCHRNNHSWPEQQATMARRF